jgi:alpha-galactosidase
MEACVSSLVLESPFLTFYLRCETGRWDLCARQGVRIEEATLGAQMRGHQGDLLWDGGLADAQVIHHGPERSPHGAVHSALLSLDFQGLELRLEFEACLEQPMFLWRVKLANRSNQTIALDAIDLLKVGPPGHGARPRRATRSSATPGALRLHADPGDLAFFSNGFQSWSFAGALQPHERMPRTRLGPILWPENPATPVSHRRGEFVSHMFGVAVDRTHRSGMLFGFLSQRQTYGTLSVRLDRYSPTVRLWAQGDGVEIAPGNDLQTDWACLQPVSLDRPDPLSPYLDAVASENGAPRIGPAPVGWCSWYKYMRSVRQEDIVSNLNRAADLRDQIPLSIVQLDDGYQAAEAELLETNARFPDGLGALAGKVTARGFVPGLWLAPFITARKSALSQRRPEWILRGWRGLPANAGSTWSVLSRGLDVTHPGVVEHTRRLIRSAVRENGFRYLKLDFLYAGVLEGRRHDPTRTRAQALDSILRVIRDEAGPEVTLLGCGCPVGSGIGVFDAMRIGTDVAPAWHPRYFGTGLFLRPEATFPAVRNVVRNVLARMPLHNRWWVNDPDCLLVRQEDTRLTPAEVQTLATVLALSGGSLMVSDDLQTLTAERLEWLGRLLPPLQGQAQVLDVLETARPSEIVLEQSGPAGPWWLLARLNWEDRPRSPALDLQHFGVPEARAYLWVDAWAEQAGISSGRELQLPAIPAHGVKLLAIRPATDEPAWMGDTLHFSQGQVVRDWHVQDGALQARLGIGRRRKGTAWLWLPGTPLGIVLDDEPLVARGLGNGVYAIDLHTQAESELAIRW